MKKLTTIIKSRLTKPKTDKEIERKRAICASCEYNTKNMEKISLYKKVLKSLSDFYSRISGNAEDDVLGNCSICTCSVFYATIYENEDYCKKGKWKTINKNGSNKSNKRL